MADPENVARIRAYLEQHRQTYDKQALRVKLLSDGHAPAAVDLALAQVYGFEVTPGAKPVAEEVRGGFGPALLGTLLFNYLLLPIGVVLLLRFGSDAGVSFLTGAVLPLLLTLLVESGAAFGLRRSHAGVARGLRWGILISLIPFAVLALLFGACIALLQNVAG